MADPIDDVELRRRDLALREAEFAHRRAQDGSFPRKWGPVLFGAMATVIVALVSAGVTMTQATLANRAQAADKQRAMDEAARTQAAAELARIDADREIRVENARAALDLYFANIDKMKLDTPEGRFHFALIATVSDNDDMKALFNANRDQAIAERAPGVSVAQAAQGQPYLPLSTGSDLAEFTVYIQSPEACRSDADAVLTRLGGAGLRTPGLDWETRVPDDSEIRYYSDAQRDRLDTAIREALGPLAASFESKTLRQSGLPPDILEVWIGEGCLGPAN